MTNGVIMQYFHWYIPDDGSLWNQLNKTAHELKSAGFTALWLPPAYKGSGGGRDVGYAVYDLLIWVSSIKKVLSAQNTEHAINI